MFHCVHCWFQGGVPRIFKIRVDEWMWMMIWENVRTLRTFEVFRTAHEFDAREQGYSAGQQHCKAPQIHIPLSAGVCCGRIPPGTVNFRIESFFLSLFCFLSFFLSLLFLFFLPLCWTCTGRRDSHQRETVTRNRNGDSILLDGNSFLEW